MRDAEDATARLAVIALDGAAFLDQFREERIADPAILDLIGRIEARIDPEIDALGPEYRHMARLTVETADGRTLEHEERHRRGSPENPVAPEEIEAKFRALAACVLPPERVEQVADMAGRLEALDDVTPLAELISPASA